VRQRAGLLYAAQPSSPCTGAGRPRALAHLRGRSLPSPAHDPL